MKYIYSVLLLMVLSTGTMLAQPGNGFTCQEAACLSENLGVTLNNGGSPPTPPLNFSCGVTHNNLFYAFCPESGPVTLNITPSNCLTGLGVQAIIYETDDCANFIEHVCISNGTVDPFTINFTGTPGQTYILMIDGFSGDVCDFTVSGTGIADIAGPPLDPELDPDDNPITLCEGEQIDINITNDGDQECTAYFWEVRAGLGFITLNENGTMATINGLSEGTAEVCIVADNFCYESELCFDVEVTPPPRLDPVQDVITCEQFVDFCDIYSGFFDPELSPDPFAEGWSISFHRTFRDAETGMNPIACPYDLAGQTTHTIYIRVYTGSNCYTIEEFTITFQLPVMDNIFVDPVCDGPIDLSQVVMPRDVNGLQYTRISFYENEQDAIDDVGELFPPEVTESGTYCVRAETDFGCFDVQCFDVVIVLTPEIEVEEPPLLCFTDFFEFNLDDLLVTELTGNYNADDLDVRWYEDIPIDDSDLDFFINAPRAFVYDPGCYYAVAVVLLNSQNQKYCMSNVVEVCLDTITPPEVYMTAVPPACEGDLTEITFHFDQDGPFDIEYRLSNGDDYFFSTNEGDREWTEELLIEPFTDTICVEIVLFEPVNIIIDECEPIIGDPICIRPPQGGLLTLGVDTEICEGESTNLIFTYTGTDSLTVEYTDGTNVFTINNLSNGYTEEVSPSMTTTYELVSAVNPDDCNIDLTGTATITVNNPPDFTIEGYICNGAQQYQATISISGGVPGTYTIDGNLLTNPSDTFITAWYSSNVPFIHQLDDASNCGPIEITGSENCACPNRSGTMDNDLLEVCVDGVAVGTHNMDSVTFSDDNFYFALHTGNGTTLGTVIGTSANPQFSFVPPMTTGTTYYISAVSGNDDGNGGIVLTDSCTEVSIGQPVIFYDLPTASLDGVSTICVGDQVTIPVTFTGEAPFRVRIDTNGVLFDTVLVNSTSFNLNVSPGTNPTIVTIPWLQDNIGCEGTGLDQHTVNLSPAPEATFTTSCDNTNTNYTITFNFTSGTGNYLLNGNPVPNPYTTPPIPSGQENTYAIDDDLGCGSQVLTIVRDCDCETDPGQIANTDLRLCVDETADITQTIPQVLDGNDVGGYIIFTSQNSPFQSTIAYFQTTTISINMSNPPMVTGTTYYIAPVAGDSDGNGFIDYDNDDCAQVGNIIELVWNPLPDVDFYGTEDICLTESLDLNVDLVVGAAPFDIVYTINNGAALNTTLNSLNDVLTFQGGGTLFPAGSYDIELVSVTDANGCSSSLGLVQSFNVQDTIDVSVETAVCDGTQENYQVSFTISGGSGDYSVTRVGGGPSIQTGANYTSPWIDANQTTYEFIIRDNIYDCDEDVIIGEHDCDCPNPGIVEESPLELCEDEVAVVSLPPNTGVQLFDLDTAEYILHTRDDGIRVGPPILRSFDGTFTFDPLAGMQFGVTYYISRMVGDIGADGRVDLSDECSEEVSNGQPVTWYENPSAVIDGQPMLTLDCDNLSYTLLGGNSTPAGNIQYQWILEDNGQTSSPLDGENIVVTQPGTYILEVTTLNSPCVRRDTVTVLQDDEVPVAIIAEPATLDCNAPVQLLDATGSDFGADYLVTWILPNGSVVNADSLSLPVDQPGMYTIRVYNSVNDCEQSYEVTVEEDFVLPQVNPGIGGEFDCHTDSILLAGSATTASGNFDINWYQDGALIPGENTEGLTITEGGWYAIEATDPENGCSAIDSVFVSADENVPYDALIQAFDPQCHDEENGYINVDSVAGGNLPYEYSINGGPFTLTPTFFNLGYGEYSLTVRDQNGCTWETTVTLNNPPLVEVDLGQDTTIQWGDTLDLIGNIANVDQIGEGEFDIDTIYISYLDSISCTDCPYPTGEVAPLTPTIYTITVITGDGCVATDNRRVNVEVKRPFFVPGAFSPNGDGINDFVTIHMSNMEFIERISGFKMFDRWGEPIYINDEILPSRQVELWDGMFNGEAMNPQVFVWTLNVLYKDGHEEQYKGDISLVR